MFYWPENFHYIFNFTCLELPLKWQRLCYCKLQNSAVVPTGAMGALPRPSRKSTIPTHLLNLSHTTCFLSLLGLILNGLCHLSYIYMQNRPLIYSQRIWIVAMYRLKEFPVSLPTLSDLRAGCSSHFFQMTSKYPVNNTVQIVCH